jgi:hypothetical protein
MGCLWALDAKTGGHRLDRTLDAKPSFIKVEITPLQAHEFAATQSCRDQDDDLWKDRSPAHCVEHCLDLIGVQDLHFPGGDFRRPSLSIRFVTVMPAR